MKINVSAKSLTIAAATAGALTTSSAFAGDDLSDVKGPLRPYTVDVVDTSVGSKDERRQVKIDEKAYAPAVAVGVVNTDSGSGINVVFQDYEIFPPGIVIWTAGHNMLPNEDTLSIRMDHLDENGSDRYSRYFLVNKDSWVNPFYRDATSGIANGEFKNPVISDVGFIYYPFSKPEQIPAAEFVPFERKGNLTRITASGFPGDKKGLYTDENVRVFETKYQVMITPSDLVDGQSGGAVYLSKSSKNPVKFNKQGQPKVVAVNVATQEGSKENALHTGLSAAFLDTVPFLRRKGQENAEPCFARADVKNILNMRYGPGTKYPTLLDDSGNVFAIPSDEEVRVFNPSASWSLVEHKDRIGYSYTGLLKPTSGHCPGL